MKTWLTVAEGAEYAGVSRDTIYTACERRELNHARMCGRRAIRLKTEWIDGWLERHAQGTQASPSTAAQTSRSGDRAMDVRSFPESVIPAAGETRHVERRRQRALPILLTIDETAGLLRTTRRAIYAMVERRQLPARRGHPFSRRSD
jgi:excisionase family DNA binding protein